MARAILALCAAAVAVARGDWPAPPGPADPQRPAYHFTPPRGWMNDPSKPIEDLRPVATHRFHLYFQWTPNSTAASWQGGWGPFWGHAVAESIAGPWSMLCVRPRFLQSSSPSPDQCPGPSHYNAHNSCHHNPAPRSIPPGARSPGHSRRTAPST